MVELLDSFGEFTWFFGHEFFVETPIGNFVWSDPDYQGDNTFKKYEGTYTDFLKETNQSFGRDKGQHKIRDYCGPDINIVWG